MNDYLTEAKELLEYTRFLRRDFHRHPELGFKEFRTSGIVSSELKALGLEVTSGVAETGVVAILEGEMPGPVALLRFDMDALPIEETTGAEYASENPGIMHACGHDGHTAIGLTVARMLTSHRADLAGTVKLIFQPAEEGLGGAERMVAEGVLNNPKPDFVLALHLWNENPLGWLGVTEGPAMAASETFKVKIIGKGGHGAVPSAAVDPVLAAAQVITAVQSIPSRNVHPLQASVVSVTSVHGGDAHNIIPEAVVLQGTIRSFDRKVRSLVLERFQAIVKGVSQAMGCDCEIELRSITPAVINDLEISAAVLETARFLFPGDEISTHEKTMGSEDMAHMMQDIPGCYFFIGSNNKEAGLDAAHHNPRFDFDEQALPKAAALMVAASMGILKEKAG
jgi:amidohydrolase